MTRILRLPARPVAADRAAVSGTPAGNRNKAMYLSSLAASLMSLSKRADDAERTENVTEAIAMYRGSLARTPEGDPRRPELHVQIGLVTKNLAKLTGDAEHLIPRIPRSAYMIEDWLVLLRH